MGAVDVAALFQCRKQGGDFSYTMSEVRGYRIEFADRCNDIFVRRCRAWSASRPSFLLQVLYVEPNAAPTWKV